MALTSRTQVAIIGAGPAGSLLALLVEQHGVECVLVEHRPRSHVLSRIRAGVLEEGSLDVLHEIGLDARPRSEGLFHQGITIADGDRLLHLDFNDLVGRSIVVYGQTELQRNLYDRLERSSIPFFDNVDDVVLDGITSDSPSLRFRFEEKVYEIACDFVVGCDGAHGASRTAVPSSSVSRFERSYPYAWLGVLSDTPPIDEELVYSRSARGFALCSMRSNVRSRYYLQCPSDTEADDWSDDQFWTELRSRLPAEFGDRLVVGPSIEKSVTPLRSVVYEPMRHWRLFFAGDAAHVVPPTGAKGLNLAISDVAYLVEGFVDHFGNGRETALDAYSDRALARVWQAVRFSWWMTTTLHPLNDDVDFDERLQRAELEYLAQSQAAQVALADNYTGLPR